MTMEPLDIGRREGEHGALDRTVSRRTLLRGAVTGATAASALAIVGCGGGDSAPTATATSAAFATPAPSLPVATATAAVPTAYGWTMLPSGTSQPSARRDHSLTYNADDGLIYLFAGRAKGLPSNDLWTLDPRTNAWTEVAVSGPAPAARFAQNAFYDQSRKRLVITLGESDGSTFFNDVWAFDTATATWAELGASSPERPSVRYGSGGAIDEAAGRILVSHGFTDQGRFDDTWAFDLATERWSRIATTGAVPAKRCLTRSLWVPDDNAMLLFGGQTDDNPFLGDFWALDTGQGLWAEQRRSPLPGPRNLYGASLDASGGRWLIFGGNTPDGPTAETWVYDLAAFTWSRIDVASPPPGRYSPDAAYAGTGLYVFGGHDGSTELGDSWMLAPLG